MNLVQRIKEKLMEKLIKTMITLLVSCILLNLGGCDCQKNKKPDAYNINVSEHQRFEVNRSYMVYYQIKVGNRCYDIVEKNVRNSITMSPINCKDFIRKSNGNLNK